MVTPRLVLSGVKPLEWPRSSSRGCWRGRRRCPRSREADVAAPRSRRCSCPRAARAALSAASRAGSALACHCGLPGSHLLRLLLLGLLHLRLGVCLQTACRLLLLLSISLLERRQRRRRRCSPLQAPQTGSQTASAPQQARCLPQAQPPPAAAAATVPAAAAAAAAAAPGLAAWRAGRP